MRVTAEMTYPAAPAEVFAMIADQAFQDRKLKGTGALSWEVAVRADADATVVTSKRALPTDQVPEAFRGFIGGQITLLQTETWGPAGANGSRTGTLVVEVAGAPVRLEAQLSLAPTDSGTQQMVEGELKARVPLFGGRIEKAAEPAVRAAIDAEERLGREWLAGSR